MEKNIKKDKVDLVQREILDRKNKKDQSKKEYNFVGSQYKWTSLDEQKMMTNEIENKTKRK